MAAFGYFVYLKIIWLKNSWNSLGLPIGPIGMLAWLMSAASAATFGSFDVFAA